VSVCVFVWTLDTWRFALTAGSWSMMDASSVHTKARATPYLRCISSIPSTYLHTVCWSVLQCVGVCWSVLQCVAVCCGVLLGVVLCWSMSPYLRCISSIPSTYLHTVCCSVLQCVVVCGGVLRCVAVCCSVLQCVRVCRHISGASLLSPPHTCTQCVAVCCSVLWCVVVCCSVLLCVAVCCGVMQCVAVC